MTELCMVWGGEPPSPRGNCVCVTGKVFWGSWYLSCGLISRTKSEGHANKPSRNHLGEPKKQKEARPRG